MNQIKKPTNLTKSIFDRHHYILTAVCALFLAVSMALTGCDVYDNDNGYDEPAQPGLESSDIEQVGVFITEN